MDASQFTSQIVPPVTELSPAIIFFHPGYDAPCNSLFTLPAADRDDNNNKGIHHRTALLACQIIAGNAFHGYLALSREGDRVSVPLDGVLTGESYYFVVPDDSMTILFLFFFFH